MEQSEYRLSPGAESRASMGRVPEQRAERLRAETRSGEQSEFTLSCGAGYRVIMGRVLERGAEKSKPFPDGEFIKECLLDSAELICPEKMEAFENVPLSRCTATRRIEDIARNMELQLQHRAVNFDFFSLALEENCDACDTAQLFILVRGITTDFKITEELAAMQSMKGTTTGNDLFTGVNACLDTLGLKWDKLVSVTTDGCPNPTGKNVGLLKRMQDKVTEIDPEQKLVFLHCIIHQQVLCKSVLKINHVVEVVTKIVNFIRARALNHRQFVALLEENATDHRDIDYHTAVRWLSLGKMLKSVWDLREAIQDFCVKKGNGIPQLSDADWIADLGFAVDVTALMNELNNKEVSPFMRKDEKPPVRSQNVAEPPEVVQRYCIKTRKMKQHCHINEVRIYLK
ncbi:hypothetical protein chiPu_0001724 [Chiloscyllium punctatum]|uniref:DUF4371 domain-containing protein n=1 Tax=Chiloscyllium punctatum TaxID=137246 RepID=A0A401RZ17_CHIPU|nr:hypothetical protein [Chiloscyllium punctatum]